LKANYVTNKYGYDCFADDDTGLEVAVLNGEPGVFSARYAGDNAALMTI
jgi:XTP/dITP diphosphohydrolase